jgi:hypothetical protein
MIVVARTLTTAATLIRTISLVRHTQLLAVIVSLTLMSGKPMQQDIVTMKRPATSNIRNHVAKALWTPKFRPQVTKNPKAYTRKEKHKVKYA